jgi:hypothetical protein
MYKLSISIQSHATNIIHIESIDCIAESARATETFEASIKVIYCPYQGTYWKCIS